MEFYRSGTFISKLIAFSGNKNIFPVKYSTAQSKVDCEPRRVPVKKNMASTR